MIREAGVNAGAGPDPTSIATLSDLAREFTTLRRREARPGQRRLSVRDVAARIGKAPSTIDPYLTGRRLCPADVYEALLRALGVPADQFRPWLDAWDRLDDAAGGSERSDRGEDGAHGGPVAPTPLTDTIVYPYRLALPPRHPVRLGIVTGFLRQVRCAGVWVNPENTNMRMARFEDYSVSAVIRFEGAVRDGSGRVVRDTIADELAERMTGRTLPVAPGTVVVTGSGELLHRNGVRYILHVAAVHGEPGRGYRQVLDIGRCASNIMAEMDRLAALPEPARSILIPLLGTGVGGGHTRSTAAVLLGAVLDHFATGKGAGVAAVYLLAHTDVELEICRDLCDRSTRLVAGTAS
jgi:O-acetyl-ADP-ribose deacetylase (regulator of RNase III)/transcriptional regulator with XRE-family HTH domain